MTYKEKVEYLNSYQYHMRKIIRLQNELDRWHTMATSITQKISPVIVNTNEVSSKVENCAIKCSEIERAILNEIQIAMYNREQIDRIINNVKDLRRRELLEMRYQDNMSVRQIAIKLDKAEDNIYKMLRTTIKNIDI